MRLWSLRERVEQRWTRQADSSVSVSYEKQKIQMRMDMTGAQ